MEIVKTPPQIETGLLARLCRLLSYFLLAAVALVIWNGNITAIEVKDFVVQIVCLLIALPVCCRLISRKEIFIPLDPLLFLVAAYLLLLLLRFAFTTQSSLNVRAVVPHVYGVIFFLLLVFSFNRSDLGKIARVLAVVATATAVHGICQYFNVDFVDWLDKGYVFSTFGQKNVFAVFLLLQIPLAAFLAVQATSKSNSIVWLVLASVMFTCLFLTGSRAAIGGFVLAALGITVLVFIGKAGLGKKEVKYGLFFLLLLLAVLVLGYKKIVPQIQGLMDINSPSVAQRLVYYKSAVEIIKESPFAGTGPGNFVITYPQHTQDAATIRDPNNVTKHVHSDFLEIWAEYGIFTLVAYLGVIAVFGSRLIRAYMTATDPNTRIQSLLLLLSLGAYFFCSQVSEAGRYMSSAFYFWTLLGMSYLFLKERSPSCSYAQLPNILKKTKKVSIFSCCLLIFLIVFMASRVYANYASDVYMATSLKYSAEKKHDAALHYLAKANDLNPKSIEAHYQRGYLFFLEKNYDRAIEDFTKVYQLAPDYTNTAFNLASCFYRQRDCAGAINWLNITYRIYPQYIPCLYLLAECHFYLVQYEKSIQYCDELLNELSHFEIDPSDKQKYTIYNNALRLKNKLTSFRTNEMEKGTNEDR